MATEVGTRIKRARERRRWSQRQLAEALKVDRKTVDNWENGRTSPRSSVGAIEEVLGVSLSEPEPEPDPVTEGIRETFRNAGYSDDRADYFASVVEGLRNGTLIVTRRLTDPEPPAEQDRRRAAG